MNRRQFLRAGLLAGTGALAGPMINRGRFSLFADGRRDHSSRAVELVGRSMVIDMLGLLTLDWPKLYGWQRDPAAFGSSDLKKLRSSGVRVFHPAVDPNSADPYAAAVGWMEGWNRLLDRRSDAFLRIAGAPDLKRMHDCAGQGKVGIVLGFQSSGHFRTVDDVARFYGLGQRVSQLTYNSRDRLGCGCFEERDSGLTAFGAQVVAAMNRLGMAVDVSHCSERTSLDAIAASIRPVLVTHSNCRALVAHPRCKSDAVLRALAARGGVMGITTVAAFVSPHRHPTVEDLLNHFDHVARTVGVEHVGIGSDTDVDAADPATGRPLARYALHGLAPARRVFDLAEGLVRRGYGDDAIELILGGNFRRVLGEIWG
ncbi:MAG TPA: membrane dipeptidase [Thermoanaerobaculia bacterium]|nr:membrane dipeptidase [Thermoanaerobaculia bacterium]